MNCKVCTRCGKCGMYSSVPIAEAGVAALISRSEKCNRFLRLFTLFSPVRGAPWDVKSRVISNGRFRWVTLLKKRMCNKVKWLGTMPVETSRSCTTVSLPKFRAAAKWTAVAVCAAAVAYGIIAACNGRHRTALVLEADRQSIDKRTDNVIEQGIRRLG